MEGLIAVTYRCNAKCTMCNIWKYPSKKEEEITLSDIERLPKMSFTNITGGEPFLREDLEEIIKIIRKKTKRIVISTNGYFTDRIVHLAEKYKDIGIRISIEGLPKVNDELRGIKNGFDRGLRTLLALHQLGLKDIGFGITVSDANAEDMMMLYELSKAMNLEFATAVVHNTYYFHKFDNKITKKALLNKEFDKLIKDLLCSRRVKNWYRAYFNFGLKNYINGGKRLLPCEAGTVFFYMDPFGEIRPCNGMEVSMGNLKYAPFEKIWNSEEAKKVRDLVANCDKNCWMTCSVRPAMKKYIWKPTMWIIKNKLRNLLR